LVEDVVPFCVVDGEVGDISKLAMPFCGVAGVSEAKSRIQFGSRRMSSGIASMPSGRGYCSRRHWRSLTDQGTKDPSMLGEN
jgi:hypothetical protein